MGCLTTTISLAILYDINTTIVNKNDRLQETFTNENSITTHIYRDSEISSVLHYTSGRITTRVSLICEVTPGKWEVLEVVEGIVITIDGDCILVRRNGE